MVAPFGKSTDGSPGVVEPQFDVARVKAHELAYLEERHAVFGDESANEPLRDPKLGCERGDIDESTSIGCRSAENG